MGQGMGLWYSPARDAYMTEEEIQQNKGAILLELSENAQQLKNWRVEAEKIGNDLAGVATQLLSEPERLVFSNEETDLSFQNKNLYESKSLDLAEVRRIRDNIRKLELRRRELERYKSSYGIC